MLRGNNFHPASIRHSAHWKTSFFRPLQRLSFRYTLIHGVSAISTFIKAWQSHSSIINGRVKPSRIARGHVGCWVEIHPASRTVWGVEITPHVCHYKRLTHFTLDKMIVILADDNFKCIFLNENYWIPIRISLEFVPTSPIVNISALVQVMAWRLT